MGKLHNVVVKECKKRLRMLRRDPEYRALKKVYAKTDGASRREAGAAMNALVKSYGLTENSLHAFIRPWQARNRHLVSSHQAQEEASRVYAGVEKVLYGKGKDVHFKKAQDILTIASKSWNGLQYYDPLHTGYYKKSVRPVYPEEIFYLNTHFRVVIDWNDPYVRESLNHPVRYAQIERKIQAGGTTWYCIWKGMPLSGILPPMPWQGLTPASPLWRLSLRKPVSWKNWRRTVKDTTGRSPAFPDRSSVP